RVHSHDCPVLPTRRSSDLKLEVFLTNTGLAFADKPSPVPAAENLAMLDGNGDTASNQGSPYGPWSKLGSPPRVPTMTFVPQGSRSEESRGGKGGGGRRMTG